MRITSKSRRSGAAVIEAAIVTPIVFMLLIAILIGAFMISTYQEVAAVTREAARYASVHGTSYQKSTGQTAATPTDVYNNAIKPRLVNIEPQYLNYGVTWGPNNKPGSLVTVTLTYTAEFPLYGKLTFTSTSTQEISY